MTGDLARNLAEAWRERANRDASLFREAVFEGWALVKPDEVRRSRANHERAAAWHLYFTAGPGAA